MKSKRTMQLLLILGSFFLVFSFAEAATFGNPLKHASILELFNGILGSLRSWIAIVAIIFLVIGGLMYMMSAGDEKMITRAKSTIGGALIGLAIALASPTFLKELLCILNASGTTGCTTVVTGGTAESLVSSALSVQQIAFNVLKFLLSIVGVLGIIGLVTGGTFYLTAYGDEKRLDKGKQIVTYSIVGIVIALAALLLVKQVMALLV
ncbi:MAG TPA: hypothetical protein VF390_01525 [Patescibacteria group bacterium]